MERVPAAADTAAAPTIASVWGEVAGAEPGDATLEWPPDVFALAGTVLGRTHAYRFAVSPPAGRHWPPRRFGGWNEAVTDAAQAWCSWTEERQGPPPELVAVAGAVVQAAASVELDAIADGSAWE